MKCGPPGKVCSHDNGVDEITDQRLQLCLPPATRRSPYQYVFLARVAMQERFECREQNHVKGRPAITGNSLEALRQVVAEAQALRIPLISLNARPRPVGRKVQRWQLARQLIAPVLPELLASL